MEVYLIRHGQSVNNALMEDQHLRVPDPELTEIGHKQAALVADYLANGHNRENIVRTKADAPERKKPFPHDLTHLYCSAMHRAMQTVRPIADATGIMPEIWLEIHEHGGIFLEKDGIVNGLGGKTRAEIMAEFPGYTLPDTITDQGWWKSEDGTEDITLCRARAMRVAAELRERATHETTMNDRIGLVTHGTFMDCLLKALMHNLPGDYHFHWHYNTAITRIDFRRDGRFIIRCMNRVDHLPPEYTT